MQLINKNTSKQKLILESKNIYTSIMWLALPIFLSNFMKAINDFIDMFFISSIIDPVVRDASQAAVQVTGPVFMISQAVAGGLMIAGSAMIAQYIGAKEKEKASRVTGQLLKLCAIAGLLMNFILFVFAKQIMVLVGAEGEALKQMIIYLRYRSFEMVPLFTYFAFHASRQASGDTLTPFLLNIIMILFNIFGTWFLVGRFGLKGAAVATMLSHVVIMPIFLYMLIKPSKKHIFIQKSDLKNDPIEIKKIFQLGWPAAISQGFTSFGFLVINALILSYNLQTVNAFGVGNRINSLVLMPAMGIGGVVATFVGQNIGARNEKRARESVKASMILAVLISAIGAAIVFPFSESLVKIFLKDDLSVKLSVEYLFFLLTGLPLMGIFQVFMGAYQGSGESKYSLAVATIRLWIMRIPMVLFFKEVLHLPPSSLWYAMVISNVGSAYVGTIYYSMCKFKPKVRFKAQELEEAEAV